MEIQTVTRFLVDGVFFDSMEDARRALAVAVMFSNVHVENLYNTMISNPHLMVAVLNDYINDLSAIKPDTVILVDKFVQPTLSEGWPMMANSPCYIDSFSRMCEEAARLVGADRRIDAIKMVRLCFGDNRPGLREAKNWVEALR